jgi:hypothetical protein
MKKTFYLIYLSILIVVSFIGLTVLSCNRPVEYSSPANQDLANFKDFSVNAGSVGLNTNVRGTIFVKGNNSDRINECTVQIIALIEIDDEDWGGVSFYIPDGWRITGISSDYPRGNPVPEAYTSSWHTAADMDFPTFVEIGHTKFRSDLNQGGTGSLIIELAPVHTTRELPENLKIKIGVGSKGEVILNPVVETIQVPLNADYRTVRDL